MSLFIALLRGINVGGKRLPMRDLTDVLEGVGASDVRTYIQSGNAVFVSDHDDGTRLAAEIGRAIEARAGFEPSVLLLRPRQLVSAIEENPFPEAESDPKSLHLGFLASSPERPDLDRLAALRKESERYELRDRVFYLHAPEGIGRSKLHAASEKALGVAMTDRNWRTVCKLRDMIEGVS